VAQHRLLAKCGPRLFIDNLSVLEKLNMRDIRRLALCFSLVVMSSISAMPVAAQDGSSNAGNACTQYPKIDDVPAPVLLWLYRDAKEDEYIEKLVR
jgi:hypothetical protein